jgi:hypothetical protein
LISLNGYDHAKSALERSIARKGPGKKAIQYAGGIVKEEKREGQNGQAPKPRSSVAVRRDE